MSKFNKTTARSGPLIAHRDAEAVTYEGAIGTARDLKTELFLLAVANLGVDTFYESAGARDDRYTQLVRQAAVAYPRWTAAFLGWLRRDANMRSASIVGAAEYVHARLAGAVSSEVTNRQVIDSVLRRADEPGELIAYWTMRHGRAIPKPVKRGIADAIGRLYTEKNLLKYDTASKGYRFGDIIELVHPSPVAPWQGDLFKSAIDRRHGRDNATPASLTMLRANEVLRGDPAGLTDLTGWPRRA